MMTRLPTILLLALATLTAATDQDRSSLTVRVRPEAALEVRGGEAALVNIRLSHGAHAVFAVQDACTGPPEDGSRIEQSGRYVLSLNKRGKLACLYTTEKILTKPIPSR